MSTPSKAWFTKYINLLIKIIMISCNPSGEAKQGVAFPTFGWTNPKGWDNNNNNHYINYCYLCYLVIVYKK